MVWLSDYPSTFPSFIDMSAHFLAECWFTDSSPVSLRRYGLKIASKMGSRKKLKYVVVTALLDSLVGND